MDKAKVLERLINETGYSKRAFAEKCGIPESTLYTILKRGVGGASVNIVITICKQLGITVEDLDEMSKEKNNKGLEKINEYKKKLGMTTEELSEKSGVPIGTLNKILSGATKDPKLETLKAIARVLGLSLDDFDDYSKKSTYEPTYDDIQSLIARNGKKLTLEQKQDIIRTLLSDD